jgi:hypothetical protein
LDIVTDALCCPLCTTPLYNYHESALNVYARFLSVHIHGHPRVPRGSTQSQAIRAKLSTQSSSKICSGLGPQDIPSVVVLRSVISSSIDHSLSQYNTLRHIFRACFSRVHFNSILQTESRSQSLYLPSAYRTEYCIFCFFKVCSMNYYINGFVFITAKLVDREYKSEAPRYATFWFISL